MVYSLSDEESDEAEDVKVSFKELEKQNTPIQIPVRSRRGQYSKPSIQLNNCYGDPLDFSSSSWREQFAEIQQCYSENYTGNIPLGKRSDSFFQSYVIENEWVINSLNLSQRYQFFENGISWVYATHTCYNYRSFMVEYFVENSQYRNKIAKPPHFQYRWGFKSFGIPFPENDPNFPLFGEDNGSWIIVPGWLKHTSHLTQNAIIINHHLHYMNSLPPVCLSNLLGWFHS